MILVAQKEHEEKTGCDRSRLSSFRFIKEMDGWK